MARFYPTGGTDGANVSVVTALAEDVAKGKVIVGPDGKPITGTLELTGTAADSQVLAGQTYYNTDLKGKRTGTMTNRGAWNSSGLAAGAAVTIPAGYHNGGGKVTAKDLASQTPGDATAAQIWTGKKAWVGGRQITGTLATQGGSTTTPGTAAKTIVTPNKIVTGNIIVAGDGNLKAANIKKNVTIFGVKGTHDGFVADINDIYNRGGFGSGFSQSSFVAIPQDIENNWGVGCGITFNASYMSPVAGSTQSWGLKLNTGINASAYSKINVIASNAKRSGNSIDIKLYFFKNNPSDAYGDTNSRLAAGSVDIGQYNTEETTGYVDISSVGQVGYLTLSCSWTDEIRIHKIWLT